MCLLASHRLFKTLSQGVVLSAIPRNASSYKTSVEQKAVNEQRHSDRSR